MFGRSSSSSSSSSSDGDSSSSRSAASSSTSLPVSSTSSSSHSTPTPEGGVAGFGRMDSMSAACTPLKHKYDACFTNWFVEYLGLPQDASDGPKVASSDSFGSAGFWSRGKSAGGEGSDRRTALREKLEGECGAVWSAYRDCVKRAVVEKQLEGPIAEARAHNPFPFPGHDSGAPHTPPFPFASQAGAKDP